MKKLLFLLLALTVSAPAYAQTQTQYYTVPTIAALKAMTTSRPAVVQVVDSNPGIFNLSVGACAAADDIFQVQPTSGTTVCYTRMATKYSIGSTPLPGANGGTGVANTGKTITLGGNLTTTGAFNTTFAASGSYTYTLPGSTSTLAILSANTFTGVQTLPNGSVSAPTLKIGDGVGLYRDSPLSADYSPGMAWADITSGKQIMTLHYGQDTSGGSNADAAVLRLGTGQAITKQTADVYIGTIRAPSVSVSGGGGAHFIMLNIGSMSATFAPATYTGQFATIEADKTDAYSAGGAVTLNDTAGMRVVGFTPRDAVTIVHNKALVISPAVRYDTGSSTSYSGIYVNALNIAGIGTAYGMRFADNPAGGSIASNTSVDLSFNAGGVIDLKTAGTTMFKIGTSGTGNYFQASAGNTPIIYANASGGGGNVDAQFSSAGTGNTSLMTGAGAVEGFRVSHRASGVNYISVQPGVSGGNARFQASAENIQLGSGSALATNATSGHVMIPGGNGVPTGAPTGASAGAFALYINYAANTICFYNSGWTCK